MNHPDIMSANGKLRFDSMLESAEQYRRAKCLHRDQRGLYIHALLNVRDALIALGSRLKVQRRTDTEAAVSND